MGMSNSTADILRRGIPEWDSSIEYQAERSWVQYNGKVYKCIQSGINKQPDTQKIFWENILGLRDGFVTPSQFPADTPQQSIINALNYLHNIGGGTLLITEDLTLTGKVVGSWSNVTIDFNGHTITWSGAGADSLFQGAIQNVGSLTATVGTVASDSVAYSNAVTLTDASAFTVGDVVFIDSASGVSPGVYLNIVAKVVSKSGNTLFTDVVSRLPITASEGVSVTKVNPVRNFWIKNGKMVATGQTSRANGMGAVYLAYAVDSGVDKFKSEGFWFKGVKTTFCNNINCYDVEVSKPTAVGGGEGYGVQYEYTYNSNIYRPRGFAVRHLTDHTASFGCEVYDGICVGSTDAAYNLHSAYEFDIGFVNCRSYGSATNDFALGGTSTGFADFTDKIRLTDCYGKGSASESIKFASKGKGLDIIGGEFSPTTSAVAYSCVVGLSGVNISDAILNGGLQVATGEALPTDGKVRLEACTLVKNPNTRSILIGTGGSADLMGCYIIGQITLAVNAKLKVNGGSLTAQNSTDQLYSVTPSLNGQEIYFTDMRISTSATFVTGGYTFTAAKMLFDNVEFDSGAHPFTLNGVRTVMNGVKGSLRALFNGTTVTDLAITNPSLVGLSDGSRVFQIINFTGRATITGGTAEANARTNTVIDFSDAGNSISALTLSNIQVKGVISAPDARITRCNISGILGDGATSVLPTAGATKIVMNNVFY